VDDLLKKPLLNRKKSHLAIKIAWNSKNHYQIRAKNFGNQKRGRLIQKVERLPALFSPKLLFSVQFEFKWPFFGLNTAHFLSFYNQESVSIQKIIVCELKKSNLMRCDYFQLKIEGNASQLKFF
jgi:hypothetical protein